MATATFLHEGFGHLLGNLVALCMCASVSERFVGRVPTAAAFFLGGAAGAVLAAALSEAGTVMIGASAGVAAVWTLGMAASIRRPHRRLRTHALGRLRLVALVGIVATLTGGFATAVAHAAGVLAGLAWVLVMWSEWQPRSKPALSRLSAGVVIGFIALTGWGLLQLREDFGSRASALVALESLMAESDIQRLRGGSLAAAEGASVEYPDDPRVLYILAHKLLDAGRFAESDAASVVALASLEPRAEFFSSGALEGSIRQLRILAADAGGLPGVIRGESEVLCSGLRHTDAGVWTAARGLCE
jgi:hypothetical protein